MVYHKRSSHSPSMLIEKERPDWFLEGNIRKPEDVNEVTEEEDVATRGRFEPLGS